MACLNGSTTYVHVYPEVDFAQRPGSPSYVFLPAEQYGPQVAREVRNSRPFFGNYGKKHGQIHRLPLTGNISGALHGYHVTSLSKSLAQFLIELGFGTSGQQNSCALSSFGAEMAQGPNVANVNHHGLMVNSMTLSGAAESGRWEYSMDVQGKHETSLATAQTVPTNLYKLIEIDYTGTTFEYALIEDGVIGDYTPINIESCQITRNNNLEPRWNGSTPYMIQRTARETSLQFTFAKVSDFWKAIARNQSSDVEDEFAWKIGLKGRTAGSIGATHTTIGIQVNRAKLLNPVDTYNISALTENTLSFDCLVPDAALADIAFTFGTEGGEGP